MMEKETGPDEVDKRSYEDFNYISKTRTRSSRITLGGDNDDLERLSPSS